MTKFAIDDPNSQQERKPSSNKISDIQAGYFGDIKNQIFSQLEGEIEKETNKEIERWKKERRTLIKNRDKELEKEKENKYLRIEN